ncbi:amino acid adenylation domain-containing protein [Streptomyces sp. NPDC005571]|uniref:amino acid adenylation domain-containing protein n=1 Tax=Streptomyces sp. NPDC005571 TaxID=3156888 RepID=UPI0033B20355
MHEHFERQAARAPQAPALVSGDVLIRYGELDAQAAAFAAQLRTAGVGRGDIVGVCLERGVDMVVALLSVLKAGAGYAMLDPGLPEERLRDMAADARVRTVVHGRSPGVAVRLGAGIRLIQVQVAAPSGCADPRSGGDRAGDIACVMFTSGSTGRPKGVAAPHHAITATVTGQDYAEFGRGAVWLQCAPASWDAFALELWGPLLSGGTCVLYPGTRPDPLVIRQLIERHGITDMYLSGSLFNVIVDEYPEALGTLRRLTVGGETMSAPHVARALRLRPGLRLRNGYGPVEAMIFLSTHPVSPGEPVGPVPIGRPLAGKRVYVLDRRLRPVPEAAVGEVYAAGAGLAHGYTGRTALTAEQFVPDPFGAPGERMYRTGDLARRRADGVLEFAGRADGQVKIRGFRVETGEVEAVLAGHSAVERVVVVARALLGDELSLLAYVVPRGDADRHTLADMLRAHVRLRLPDFMVPTAFVAMPALPLLPSGKLDRAALPLPATVGRGRGRGSGEQARTAAEESLCGLFEEILGVRAVSVHDDFFDLGGHSLRAARLLSRIRSELGGELGIQEFFDAPTVAGLAARLFARPGRPVPPPAAVPRPDVVPLSPAQRRLWFLDRVDAGEAYTIPVLARIDGPVDVALLEHALAAVAERHEPLRTVFPEDVDGEPVQQILQGPAGRCRLVRTRVPAAGLEHAVKAAAGHRFDLSAELPWHAVLFSVEGRPESHALLLVVHHIAADGWALAPLFADLSRALAGETLPPLVQQYADHALAQKARLGDPADLGSPAARHLAHWRAKLHGLPPAPALPRRPGRPRKGSVRAAATTTLRRIDAAAQQRLLQLGRSHGATLFMVLHAALAGVLDRAAPGEDIAIGAPTAGRGGESAEDIVGFFVNLLVLRVGPVGDATVAELLTRARTCDLAAYAHEDLPFEQIVEAVNPPRLPGHHPFTDVVLVLQNNLRAALCLPGATCRIEVLRTGAARFQLLVEATDEYDEDGAPAGITLALEHQQDTFDTETIQWLADALTALLTDLPSDPAARIAAVPLPAPPRRTAAIPLQPVPPRRAAVHPAANLSATPPTGLVQRIAAVWAQVLGVPGIGSDEDFFARGGNSLRAVRAAARLANAEGLPVTTSQIFQYPTPAALAAELTAGAGTSPPADGGPIPRRRRIPRKETLAPWN